MRYKLFLSDTKNKGDYRRSTDHQVKEKLNDNSTVFLKESNNYLTRKQVEQPKAGKHQEENT